MIAGMVLTNLLYLVGSVVVATVVSAFVLLRHRRPRSLESSIEMFSRELKALEPDRAGATRSQTPVGGGPVEGQPGGKGLESVISGRAAGPKPRGTASGTVVRLGSPRPSEEPATSVSDPARDGAGVLSPEQESESG